MQKSILFIYAACEQLEIEFLRRVSFTVALKSMKYLGINLRKCVHCLYATNDETLMQKPKGVNKRRDTPCS